MSEAERLHRHGLGETGHAFHQQMPLGEQRHEHDGRRHRDGPQRRIHG